MNTSQSTYFSHLPSLLKTSVEGLVTDIIVKNRTSTNAVIQKIQKTVDFLSSQLISSPTVSVSSSPPGPATNPSPASISLHAHPNPRNLHGSSNSTPTVPNNSMLAHPLSSPEIFKKKGWSFSEMLNKIALDGDTLLFVELFWNNIRNALNSTVGALFADFLIYINLTPTFDLSFALFPRASLLSNPLFVHISNNYLLFSQQLWTYLRSQKAIAATRSPQARIHLDIYLMEKDGFKLLQLVVFALSLPNLEVNLRTSAPTLPFLIPIPSQGPSALYSQLSPFWPMKSQCPRI